LLGGYFHRNPKHIGWCFHSVIFSTISLVYGSISGGEVAQNKSNFFKHISTLLSIIAHVENCFCCSI